MDRLKLLKRLDNLRNDLCLWVQEHVEEHGGVWEQYEDAVNKYERILYLFSRVYYSVKGMHPDDPLVRELDRKDVDETIALGAPTYKWVE
ncbi:MAG: hypothetical protein AABX10_03955 [Nanoarchaeota archaeon]